MSETVKNNLKQLYEIARASVIKTQHTVCNAVNSAMVTAYIEKLVNKYIWFVKKTTESNTERDL